FAYADASWVDRAYLIDLAARGMYIHQLHYYPPASHASWPNVSPVEPCLMGEFPAGNPLFHASTRPDEVEFTRPTPWPVVTPVEPQETSPESYLYYRLPLVRASNRYAGALMWSGIDDPTSCRSRWGDSQKAQVRAWLGGQPSPGV